MRLGRKERSDWSQEQPVVCYTMAAPSRRSPSRVYLPQPGPISQYPLTFQSIFPLALFGQENGEDGPFTGAAFNAQFALMAGYYLVGDG